MENMKLQLKHLAFAGLVSTDALEDFLMLGAAHKHQVYAKQMQGILFVRKYKLWLKILN